MNTPVTKRNKLSSKRNRIQSPGHAANEKDGSSPFQSPVLLGTSRTPNHNTGRSPLSVSSLNSTPNRNWASSQEPPRDIIWDNTSPIHSRGSRGGLTNIRDMCRTWKLNSREEICPSQNSALSDKWLSMKNNAGNSVPVDTHQNNNPSVDEKHGVACGRRRRRAEMKPSKDLSSLLEQLKNQDAQTKGVLHFEETASEGSVDEDVLAPSSDPTHKCENTSLDEHWGDCSFQINMSQCVDHLSDSPVKSSVKIIPSTLSSEHSTGSSSSSNDKGATTQVSVSSTKKLQNDKGVSQAGQSKAALMAACARSPNSIACTKFYDRTSTVSQKPVEYKCQLRSQRASQVLGNHLPTRQQKTFSNSDKESKLQNDTEIATLSEKEMNRLLIRAPVVGMPRIWMSESSSTSSSGSNEVREKRHRIEDTNTGSRQLQSKCPQLPDVSRFTKIRGMPSKTEEKTSRSEFQMLKCAQTTWKSQIDEGDDEIWDDLDFEVFSQEKVEELDKVIEIENQLFSQSQNTCQDANRKLESKNNALGGEQALKTSNSVECNGQVTSQGSLDSSKMSQQSGSNKRQYSRVEINRKKAEALRRRRLREGTVSRTNSQVSLSLCLR